MYININRSYLGIVAHECNIFSVSRQLVVISSVFPLRWKKIEMCCTSLVRTTYTTLLLFRWTSRLFFFSFTNDTWFMLLAENLQNGLCSRTLRNSLFEHCAKTLHHLMFADTHNLWRKKRRKIQFEIPQPQSGQMSVLAQFQPG